MGRVEWNAVSRDAHDQWVKIGSHLLDAETHQQAARLWA